MLQLSKFTSAALAHHEHIDAMTSDVDDAEPPRVYTRRWFVLSIVATSILLRGFNQSCFGPSNNLLANYFNVEPWQIDWLVIVQSVIFLVASLPLSMMTVRLGYRFVSFVTDFVTVYE